MKDGDEIDYKDLEVGEQNEEELKAAIHDSINRAAEHLPAGKKESFNNMVLSYKDIFRIRLGKDDPVKVTPMEIKFEGPENPIKVRQRTYSPEQLDFLRKKCDDILQAGYVYRNPTSKWACAPLIVPKPGPDKFRLTVDLRPINAQTKKNDPMLAKLTGSKIFFKLDFLHGYWQFPLDKDSQECQSFHIPFGVFSPTRVLHGATNAVSYFNQVSKISFRISIFLSGLTRCWDTPLMKSG